MALVDELKSIKDQLEKAKSEIVGKVENLETAVAASGTPSAEVTDAVAELKAVAQSLDDLVPDSVVEAPAEEVEAPAEEEVPAEVPEEVVPVPLSE